MLDTRGGRLDPFIHLFLLASRCKVLRSFLLLYDLPTCLSDVRFDGAFGMTDADFMSKCCAFMS